MHHHDIRTSVARGWVVALLFFTIALSALAGNYKVYSTYLWHLQQPNYWPEKLPGQNRYMFAYEHLGGSPSYPGHPLNNLAEIFGKDDRKAVYQYRARDAVAAMNQPDGGAQLSYSGCLIENIRSLGDNYSLGYTPGWNGAIKEAMGWTTTRGHRKLEPVGFTYHHALAPLIDKDALAKEIAINKEIWWKAWGGNSDKSDHPKGFRCAEETFSIRIIKELVEAGYEWVIVPNHHLSRTHPNYVQLHGSGLYDPPNKADQINADNGTGVWYSGQEDGRGTTESVPFSFQAHRARYVDPETGTEYKIIVVPMTDLGSYHDGFSQQGIGILDLLDRQANYSQPCLALFSHDGDNAWGGGFSYYGEAAPNFSGQAASAGYRPTTIQTFLDENPPPVDDIVHVEDGSWVNAADDWGHPLYINWLWPPQRDRSSPSFDHNDPATYADIEGGWAEDFRNWAVIVAAQNYVSTAEQIFESAGGTVLDWKIQEPVQVDGTDNGANDAELAWHFFLPALTSGYMYYGTAIDMEVKPTLACNQGLVYAKNVVNGYPSTNDLTGPTVFIPQRYPYNPGTTNYGAQIGYRTWVAPSDFYIWTFAYDLSGLTSVVLKVRVDSDGSNPLSNNDNETYSGGPSVGSWQSFSMNQRAGSSFRDNVTGNPEIDFFITPDEIADEYWYYVTGFNNVLLDYYVEAYDTHGNVKKTDIQHVFVGSEGGSTPVLFSPNQPEDCEELVVTYHSTGRALDGISPVYINITFDEFTTITNAIMASLGSGSWIVTNGVPSGSTNTIVYFNDTAAVGAGTIDNNGGTNWNVAVIPCEFNEPPTATFNPAAPNGCDDVTITYNPGTGPLQGASPVHIHIGRNNWQDVLTNNTQMTAGPSSTWTYVYSPPPGTIQINCVFKDSANPATWDNNGGNDWAADVENCSGGVTQGIHFVEGSPAVTTDPALQNNMGDNFDLDQSGGDAVTTDQGGFGTFGHVYVNYDDTNFYIGGVDADAGGSNNAMVIFLGFNTLNHDVNNLWLLSGAPQGLDSLHNLWLDPGLDIAVVIGDEYGDSNYPSFNLGDGYDFGQGVFHLNGSSFSVVPHAQLSQFDGVGTTATTSDDDDGNRLVDRWEVCMPWSDLNATNINDLTACYLAGVLVNSSTSGVDRYISGNYLGLSATNDAARDAFNNFAFTFVTLDALSVGLPDQDSDGDGLPDDWEERYYGGITNATPSADDDADGYTNQEEYRLGTHPQSSSSLLVMDEVVTTGDYPRVTWPAVGGRSYSVQFDDDLKDGVGFVEATQVTESSVPDDVGTIHTFIDDYTLTGGEPADGVRSYRIELVSP